MGKAEQMIKMYRNLSLGCAAAASGLLIVAVVLFAVFRIPEIWKLDIGPGRKSGKRKSRRKKLGRLLVLGVLLLGWADTASAQETVIQDGPAIEAVWKNAQGERLQEYYQTGECLEMELTIWEEHLDKEHTVFYLSAADISGRELDCPEREWLNEKSWADLEQGLSEEPETAHPWVELQEEEGKYTLRISLQTEARYSCSAVIQDESGNQAEGERLLGAYCLDRTAPKIQTVYDTEGHPTGDITWEAQEQTFLRKLIHGVSFGCFCKPVLKVRIQARDTISGISEITYTYEGLKGEEQEEVCVTETVRKGEELQEDPDHACAFTVLTLPQTFQGTVRATASDCGGIPMEEYSETVPLLSESEETHKRCAKAQLLSLEGEGKQEHFYRSDIRISFALKDTFSGLRRVEFRAGDEEQIQSWEEENQEAVTEADAVFEVSASKLNQNRISLSAVMTDLAGHQMEVEGLPLIHMDTRAPEVEVQWSNLEARNGNYYKADRTAVILVKERNFDPEDVELTITGMEVPALSWNHLAGAGCQGGSEPEDPGHCDDCIWRTEVNFDQDGVYTFGFSCVDAAGNRGSYGKTEEFVLDKTSPVVKVFWNPAEGKNGKYFNQKRYAIVEVREENFAPADAEIRITASDLEVRTKVPEAGPLRPFSDESWRAGVSFAWDGEYQLEVECMDLAGNVSELYQSDTFVVDLTRPALVFEGPAERSANPGSIHLGLRVTDANYAPEEVEIVLTGCHGTGQLPACRREETGEGGVWSWAPFSWIPENDDLYGLSVSAVDLAGNQTENTFHFSVNRFGSVYVLEEKTKKLAGTEGSCYTNQAPELIITEYNADFLEEQKVSYSLEGEETVLEPEKDYTTEVSGDADTWKCIRYRVFPENFQREGTYTLLLTSKDRAGNRSGNSWKEAGLLFTLDRTSPEILISGIEEHGQYRSSSHEIQVELVDAFALERAEVYLNGRKAAAFDRELLQKNQGVFRYTVSESHDWQRLSVKAWDRAGNEGTSEQVTFLVTGNLLIQFLKNSRQVALAAGILAVGIGFAMWLWIQRKRNTCNPKSM